MSNSEALIFLHWFWTAFFVLFGLVFMTRGRRFLAACTADCHLKIKTADSGARERIEAAVERRQAAEGAPVPLGMWLGAFSVLLGAVAATGRILPALLYALLCLGSAFGIGAIFLRLRNSQPTRVAMLCARSPESVIPAYWFGIAVLSALSVLTYAANPAYRVAAVIVAVSALLTVAIAWRLTNLPALLSGVDITAEQLIDDRLRAYRSQAAMVFALVQTFVFCSQVLADFTVAQSISYGLTAVIWIAFAIWMFRRRFAAVQLA